MHFAELGGKGRRHPPDAAADLERTATLRPPPLKQDREERTHELIVIHLAGNREVTLIARGVARVDGTLGIHAGALIPVAPHALGRIR